MNQGLHTNPLKLRQLRSSADNLTHFSKDSFIFTQDSLQFAATRKSLSDIEYCAHNLFAFALMQATS